ncbi:leucine-rich repeat and calponin homology domain-containing protein 4 isoform X1 [Gymnodraco acuticeps]|uniref:Leucine-rich repeat and calponin homology domain-containing protein 4 isoform X1 n=1 Tax=Gymnodraco acuticeps TaxID=8218 RepID=A0A6P8W3V1_GYMAC|nr:leucine-rich repeat and calponin homology domain-containing protein 4 isoform X1 [Gymnodraco acuticeps]
MAAGDGAQLPATVAASRSVEKALEEAAASGALNLSNRKLKEFPRSARNYDLSDITHADLSKNRLCELPEELCQFISVETLSLYHNGMRSLSSSLGNLQALTYLNLSRNLLSSLPPSVFQLPLLRVLIVSNNKLCSLPASIYSLTHLRQLDVSCNELQGLPAELGQLESLRDLNLRRNQLTTLPEEISELPLVRLDVSCNRISHVPLCYRHLRHLQTVLLDNNPLQMPPAQICSKGKYHIFKYLNMEACKRNQEELERHLRPTGFNSCLSEQELFTGQFGGLDSGFNSVDSGSKRWSGNESADDFSERSLRLAEVSRDQRNLEEEEEEEEEHGSPLEANKVNGDAGHVDFIDSSVTEEEEEMRMHPPTPPLTAPPLEQSESSSPPQSHDSTTCRSSLHVDVGPPSSNSASPLSPSSPSLEERRRPGTLFIWQERERLQQQQRDKASLLKSSTKTGSHVAPAPQTGSSSAGGSPESSSSLSGLRQRCASADQMSAAPPPTLLQRSSSRSDVPSSPPGQTQRPNSFLFRTSSRTNVKPTVFTLGESGRSESRTMLRSPKEERADITQLRKTLESRLKVSLPEDLGEALTNGTVLCQLVNQIRVRSVSIIHVPSPAVPKLSSAKCRLNVENFLSACRKLGVSERDVCVCSDVLLCKLPAVLRCVRALLAAGGGETGEDQSPRHSSPSSPSPSSSSLLSTDFLLFYCAVMALLYVLYCYLLP